MYTWPTQIFELTAFSLRHEVLVTISFVTSTHNFNHFLIRNCGIYFSFCIHKIHLCPSQSSICTILMSHVLTTDRMFSIDPSIIYCIMYCIPSHCVYLDPLPSIDPCIIYWPLSYLLYHALSNVSSVVCWPVSYLLYHELSNALCVACCLVSTDPCTISCLVCCLLAIVLGD